jgi:hypothetical protein
MVTGRGMVLNCVVCGVVCGGGHMWCGVVLNCVVCMGGEGVVRVCGLRNGVIDQEQEHE